MISETTCFMCSHSILFICWLCGILCETLHHHLHHLLSVDDMFHPVCTGWSAVLLVDGKQGAKLPGSGIKMKHHTWLSQIIGKYSFFSRHELFQLFSGAKKIYQIIFIYFSSSCCTHLKFKFHVGLLNGPNTGSCFEVVMFGCSDLLGYLLDIPQNRVFGRANCEEFNGNNTSPVWMLPSPMYQVDPGPLVFLCGLATMMTMMIMMVMMMMMMMMMMMTMMTMTMSDDDDVAVLFKHVKHAFNTLYIHVFVFINNIILKYCSGLSTAGPQVKRWQRIVIPLRRVLRVPIKWDECTW